MTPQHTWVLVLTILATMGWLMVQTAPTPIARTPKPSAITVQDLLKRELGATPPLSDKL